MLGVAGSSNCLRCPMRLLTMRCTQKPQCRQTSELKQAYICRAIQRDGSYAARDAHTVARVKLAPAAVAAAAVVCEPKPAGAGGSRSGAGLILGLLFTPPVLVIALRGRPLASRTSINHDKVGVRNIKMNIPHTRWQTPLQFDSTNTVHRPKLKRAVEKKRRYSRAFYVMRLQDKVTYLMQPPSPYRSARFPFSTMSSLLYQSNMATQQPPKPG
ncbi:hypothetical protein ACQKWADRAFT_1553 [Trichoderma austrokoningii]